jgi:predicted flap endonuclease-1-like 5' DNA nuclease
VPVAVAAAVAAEAAPAEPVTAPVVAAAAPVAPETVAPEPVTAPVVVAAAAAAEEQQAARHMLIEEVEGIGPAYAEKLAAAGIKTTDDLLTAGAKPQGREKIAEGTGISEKLILGWVNKVDLMRVPGVGPQYSDLLEAAGVDSPAELSHRNAANLADAVQSVVAERPGIVRRTPTEMDIAAWIEEAGKLAKVVEH